MNRSQYHSVINCSFHIFFSFSNGLAQKHVNVSTISHRIQQTHRFSTIRDYSKVLLYIFFSAILWPLVSHFFSVYHTRASIDVTRIIFLWENRQFRCCAGEIAMSWEDFDFESGFSLRSNELLVLFQLQALSLNCCCVYSYDTHINYSTNIKRATRTRLK